ncbi:MAG TPA: ABC transporter permease [Methanospirillum sp.]|uniref:ABC transporter permease n=1 Tax=Methanospirillum sp. TaxID=45200 RepID=UPI002B95A160|nr:ABC transporter permease [Methanospirillum sp.]HWQ63018.1 ABC transporter permease [Methanospirillum sp.]
MNYGILTRLVFVFPTLIGVTLITFGLVFLSPGDPAEILLHEQYGSVDPSAEVVAEFKESHGLNDPVLVQYYHWLCRIATGDFGISFRTGNPVFDEFSSRFSLTLQIALFSEILAFLIALPLGIISACRQNSWIDHLTRAIALCGISIPGYWLGAVSIFVFALCLRWVRVLEDSYPTMLILPVLILTFAQMSTLMRLTRAGMLETLRQNYIRTARSKGLSERRIVWVHGLKNAIIPVITIFCMQLGSLAAGTVIIETVFTLNGVGSFLIESIYSRDIPVIQGFFLIIALMYIIVNLFADIVYCIVDPRVRIRGMTPESGDLL